jgi:hypothetical protein
VSQSTSAKSLHFVLTGKRLPDLRFSMLWCRGVVVARPLDAGKPNWSFLDLNSR